MGWGGEKGGKERGGDDEWGEERMGGIGWVEVESERGWKGEDSREDGRGLLGWCREGGGVGLRVEEAKEEGRCRVDVAAAPPDDHDVVRSLLLSHTSRRRASLALQKAIE